MYESGLKKIIRNSLLSIYAFIVVILTFLCLFFNAYISSEEKTSIVRDNPIKLIIYFVMCLICLLIIRRNYRTQKSVLYKKIFLILSLILFMVSLYVIFFYDVFPVADQKYVLEAVSGLRNGDYSHFLPNGYVGMCSNQSGIVVIFYYLSFFLGDYNYQILQVINIFALIACYYSMCKIAEICFHDKELKLWTLILLVLFIPLTLYITFVYGTLSGLAFSLYAVLCGYRYSINRKIKDVFLMIICMMVAMMLKSNYAIVDIALIIFVLFDIFFNKNYKSTLIMISLILVYFLSSWIPQEIIQRKTGIELGNGIPMTAYIEMGLQDTSDAPGWWNRYNWDVYTNNGCDSEKASEQVKVDLKNTISNYLENPGDFIDFLYRKTLSQWSNPDFQGTWITQYSEFSIDSNWYYQLMNILQTIILLGTLAYIVLAGRHMPLQTLVLPMIFIGGFVFHLFWEAKGQYTITYFALLIPYCAKGFLTMSDDLAEGIATLKRNPSVLEIVKHFSRRNTIRYIVGLIVICLIMSLLI